VPVDILSAMAAQGIEVVEVCEPVGCEHCRGTGYHGRTVVSEILAVSEEIRGLIRSEPDIDRIRAAAIRGGMRPMLVDGLGKVARGETSLDEVVRSVGRIPA
jgi:general secretion pathway protein E